MKKEFSVFLFLFLLSTAVFSTEVKNIEIQLFNYNSSYEFGTAGSRHKDPPADRESRSKGSRSGGNSLSEAIFDFIFELIVELAVESNTYAVFDEYPYATSPYYVQYDSPYDDITDFFNGRFCRFDAGINNTFYANKKLSSPTIRFDGYIFKYFGPVFEHTSFTGDISNNPYFGNLKLGGEFALFQTFFLSSSVNICWDFYYGDKFLSNINFGLLLKSYPFKPFVIEYRVNWTGYFENAYRNHYAFDAESGIESYLEIGAMVNDTPYEIYGFWKYLLDVPMQINDNGFGVGLKYFF